MMTTNHYRTCDGQHVFSRRGAVVAVIERDDDHYLLRRILAGRQLRPQRFTSFHAAELAAFGFADGLSDTLIAAPRQGDPFSGRPLGIDAGAWNEESPTDTS